MTPEDSLILPLDGLLRLEMLKLPPCGSKSFARTLIVTDCPAGVVAESGTANRPAFERGIVPEMANIPRLTDWSYPTGLLCAQLPTPTPSTLRK